MFDAIRNSTRVQSKDVSEQLDELRASALRLLLSLTTAGYVVWHVATTALSSATDMQRAFAILPVALLVLGSAWLFSTRSPRIASLIFVVGGAIAVTWALIVLEAGQIVMLYPLIALVATFVIGPLAGVGTAIIAAATTLAVGSLRPGLVGTADFWMALAWSSLAVGGVWALLRQTVMALNWYVGSYSDADRRTREAEQHRAQLVESWRQLDVAYYRLERLNDELQRARRVADEARELKSRFAAFISHELRTPLNLVVGFSEMMMTNPRAYGGQAMPPAYRQHLEAVYRNACGLSRLVDDVLDLSQIDAHRMALEKSDSSLPAIVASAIESVDSLFDQLGLTITVDVPSDLPLLHVDANRIRQILVNLLNNAARFTDTGGVTVRARKAESDVVISIADTGSGIAPEDLPHVFDAFRQGGLEGRGRHGSGLGLAICRSFAEMHGGQLNVESELGRGSTFHLALPESDATIEPWVRLPTRGREGKRVVAVLDRAPDAARVFRRYLDGYDVVWATSAVELRRLASEISIGALVLTGSEKDGRWHDAISADPALRELPLFRCSLRTTRSLAKELGVDAYLLKPVSREQLLAALRHFARGAREILVVEDDPEMMSLMVEMIRSGSRQYRIRQAVDGEQALTMLREKPADVVCLDLMLPKLDGYSVVREIRADVQLAATPVIVISATGTHDETVRADQLAISRADGLPIGELVGCLRASLDVLPGFAGSVSPRE